MKALFRLVSFVAALLAFVLIVVDGTTAISAKAFTFTSMGEFISRFQTPGAIERWSQSLSRNIHPLAWGGVNLFLLAPPAVLNLSILSLVSWMIGRKKEEEIGLSEKI